MLVPRLAQWVARLHSKVERLPTREPDFFVLVSPKNLFPSSLLKIYGSDRVNRKSQARATCWGNSGQSQQRTESVASVARGSLAKETACTRGHGLAQEAGDGVSRKKTQASQETDVMRKRQATDVMHKRSYARRTSCARLAQQAGDQVSRRNRLQATAMGWHQLICGRCCELGRRLAAARCRPQQSHRKRQATI